jgi:KTSC domain
MALRVISAPPSGNIISIQYDADAQMLLVQFQYQNSVYRYDGVNADLANGFSTALSATKYLQSSIIPISTGERIA